MQNVDDPPDRPATRQCVVVLGMHRSGTSAMAGALALLGCELPKNLLASAADNPRGFFESVPVHDLNVCFLEAAGSDWDDWTEFAGDGLDPAELDEYQSKALEVLSQEFGDSSLFVLKDPRMCRIAPLWIDILRRFRARPGFVHTHRNPLEVAQSLERRNGMGVEHALLLWLRHVLSAEAATRGLPRYFTSYGQLLNDWKRTIELMQSSLGITLPELGTASDAAVTDFLSSELRHFQHQPDLQLSDLVPESPDTSGWVVKTFEVMTRWALDGEDPADHATLSEILAELNAAAPELDERLRRIAARSQAPSRPERRLQEELSSAAARIDELTAEVKLAQDESARLAERNHQLQLELSESIENTHLRERDIKLLELRLQSRFEEIRTLTRLLEEAERDAGASERLQAVLASRSWRAGAPIRWIMDRVRLRWRQRAER